jgi:HlyD family secretion protein
MCKVNPRLIGCRVVLVMVGMFAPLTSSADPPNGGRVVLEIKGYVVPVSQVPVSPKVGGQIVEMHIEEGKRVKAGDVLAKIDPAEYEGARLIAKAQLKLAEAELVKAKEGGGTADLAIAQARVEVAQARVDLARYRLDCTVVRAPIDGTVLEKFGEVGAMIDWKALNVKGTLCLLADLRTIEVELSVQEKDVAKVAKGQPCLVRLEAYPQVTYRGQVIRLLAVGDRAKGAVGVRVRLEVPAGDDHLRPEMGAIVRIMDKE